MKKITSAAFLCSSIALMNNTNANEVPSIIEEIKEQANNTLSIPEKKDILTIDTQSLKKSPLAKKGISPSLANLLWENQVEHIITTHNPDIRKKYPKEQRIVYSEIDAIKIPLIFDELKTVFPKELENFIKTNPSLAKSHEKLGNTGIFVVKIQESEKYALAYYQDWTLRLATHTSPGKRSGPSKGKDGQILSGGIKTPEWIYTISYKETNKVSRAFENAPMPYALNVNGGVFIHTGRVDGNPLSHGCIRIPWLYAQQLFEMVPLGTKVAISFNGVSTLPKESVQPIESVEPQKIPDITTVLSLLRKH